MFLLVFYSPDSFFKSYALFRIVNPSKRLWICLLLTNNMIHPHQREKPPESAKQKPTANHSAIHLHFNPSPPPTRHPSYNFLSERTKKKQRLFSALVLGSKPKPNFLTHTLLLASFFSLSWIMLFSSPIGLLMFFILPFLFYSKMGTQKQKRKKKSRSSFACCACMWVYDIRWKHGKKTAILFRLFLILLLVVTQFSRSFCFCAKAKSIFYG